MGKTRYIYGPDYKRLPAEEGRTPFVCSLSKRLQEPYQRAKDAIRKIAEDLAHYVANNAGLSESLKHDPRWMEGRVLRQIDIRSGPGQPIVLKAFVSWSHDLHKWHIFMELPDEEVWENGQSNF